LHLDSAVKVARVRLDRALSKLGLASRSEARQLILAGRVIVAGKVVRDPAITVVPTARIVIDGRQPNRPAKRTLVFHKPRGVITTRRDPEGRPTVFDVLGDQAHGLVAAGRLDRASTGLLILTTDTELANFLTDPASRFVRRYVVTVRGALSEDAARTMERGIGGMQARSVAVRKRSARETHLIVELTEGKNREVRNLCAGVGHEVTRLKRVAFGPIELGDLAPGEWRALTPAEERALRGARPMSR
jgi:23S rRNA pseudouridine2605 synthase